MRDLMVLAAMLLIFPLATSNTFIAYLLWSWAGLIGLDGYLYGFMIGLPYVQIFALITLGTLLLRRDKKPVQFQINRTTGLLILFGCHGLLVATFAFDGIFGVWDLYIIILKVLLFCFVMPILVTSRLHIHAMVISIIFALSFHGLLDGLKFIASGGSHVAHGVRFGDSNLFALVLTTVIPLLIYMYKYSDNKWLKPGYLGLALLTVMAVVATNSRGGLITMVFIAMVLIMQSKRKVAGMLTLTAFVVIVMSIVSDSWLDRMNSVQNAESDNSFMTRVAVWKKSTAIALEHPLLGGGFGAVNAPPADKYRYSQGLLGFIDTPDPGRFVAHSIYFQVIGDMGFLGFFIYLTILFNAFYTAHEIKRLAAKQGERAMWATDIANTLKTSLQAFMVGGALLSAAYYDMPFILIMLLEATKQVLIRNEKFKQIAG